MSYLNRVDKYSWPIIKTREKRIHHGNNDFYFVEVRIDSEKHLYIFNHNTFNDSVSFSVNDNFNFNFFIGAKVKFVFDFYGEAFVEITNNYYDKAVWLFDINLNTFKPIYHEFIDAIFYESNNIVLYVKSVDCTVFGTGFAVRANHSYEEVSIRVFDDYVFVFYEHLGNRLDVYKIYSDARKSKYEIYISKIKLEYTTFLNDSIIHDTIYDYICKDTHLFFIGENLIYKKDNSWKCIPSISYYTCIFNFIFFHIRKKGLLVIVSIDCGIYKVLPISGKIEIKYSPRSHDTIITQDGKEIGNFIIYCSNNEIRIKLLYGNDIAGVKLSIMSEYEISKEDGYREAYRLIAKNGGLMSSKYII